MEGFPAIIADLSVWQDDHWQQLIFAKPVSRKGGLPPALKSKSCRKATMTIPPDGAEAPSREVEASEEWASTDCRSGLPLACLYIKDENRPVSRGGGSLGANYAFGCLRI